MQDPKPPSPASAFQMAQQAAAKISTVGTVEQPPEVRWAMLQEVLYAGGLRYHNDKHFKKGIQWLRDILDSYIRKGDYELAKALYHPIPDWVPKPQAIAAPVAAPPTEATTPALSTKSTISAEVQDSENSTPNIPAAQALDPALNDSQGQSAKPVAVDPGLLNGTVVVPQSGGSS
jgi:hypothetical protein